jgi:hypothetical protein
MSVLTRSTGVTSQKAAFFIVTAGKTSNLAQAVSALLSETAAANRGCSDNIRTILCTHNTVIS